MDNMAGNIFLVGLMGSGKTTLGRMLARHFDRPFYDSDLVICERTGVTIPTIFELEGEAGFRNREAAVIDEISRLPQVVLATGGGAVLRPDNRNALHERGCVVYLHAHPDILLDRTRNDRNRPLLQVADPLAKFQELYETRDAVYRETAHLVLDVAENNHPQLTLKKLLTHLDDRPPCVP